MVGKAYRIADRPGDISIVDTSNCTWTDWSECKLDSTTRCTRARTLEVLSFERQTLDVVGKISCHGRAGDMESQGCQDGLCPNWSIGNWTDCSGTCNSTLPPWEGYQRREVSCLDPAGVYYRTDVCENLYGVTMKPELERPCECSHKLKPYDPYTPTYRPVEV